MSGASLGEYIERRFLEITVNGMKKTPFLPTGGELLILSFQDIQRFAGRCTCEKVTITYRYPEETLDRPMSSNEKLVICSGMSFTVEKQYGKA